MTKRFRMPIDTREYPVLSKDEERIAFLEYKFAQDEKTKREAKDNLVYRNMGLVYKIIKAMANDRNGAEPDALVSYGVEGLIKAIDNFDLEKDLKLSTYAFMWIKKYVRKGIQDQSLIRLPDNVWEDIAVFQRVQAEIAAILEREPTYQPFSADGFEFSEMEDALVNGDYGFTPSEYKTTVLAWNLKNPMSLNATIDESRGKSVEFLDTFEDKQASERSKNEQLAILMKGEFEKIRTSKLSKADKIADILIYMLEHPSAKEEDVIKALKLNDRSELRYLKQRGFDWIKENSINLNVQFAEMH